MLAVKKLAGVQPEVNLRNSAQPRKRQVTNPPCFETQGRRHQKSSPLVVGAESLFLDTLAVVWKFSLVLVSPYYKTKLKGMYNTAMQDAESEAE